MMSKARFMALAIWILANAGVAECLPLPKPADQKAGNAAATKTDVYVICMAALHSS